MVANYLKSLKINPNRRPYSASFGLIFAVSQLAWLPETSLKSYPMGALAALSAEENSAVAAPSVVLRASTPQQNNLEFSSTESLPFDPGASTEQDWYSGWGQASSKMHEAAEDNSNALTGSAPLQLPTIRYQLANGLRVVLSQDPSMSSVAVALSYDVGARDEEANQSGFAHLFEHLMFQGSRNVAKGDHFKLLAAHGGRSNGTTNYEMTQYYETIPANALQLALWLEADRMNGLAISAENFDNQKSIVQEEFRMRYSNRALGMAWIKLQELAYLGDKHYSHPTIGDQEELASSELSWAKSFYNKYYGPNNAVLSIVGNFNEAETRTWIEQYFGAFSKKKRPEALKAADENKQRSQRILVNIDPLTETPAIYYGWLIPSVGTTEHRALELASIVLSGGDSSRLNRSLVREKSSATEITSSVLGNRERDLLTIKVEVSRLSDVDKNHLWLDGELKRLRLIGPSELELSRAKAILKSNWLKKLEGTEGRARALGRQEILTGNADSINQELDAYAAISSEVVRAAAKRYLPDHLRSVVEAYPPKWQQDIPPKMVTQQYVVKKGDALLVIARRYKTTIDVIQTNNGMGAKTTIYPGQVLKIPVLVSNLGSIQKSPPAPKIITITVKKGDTLLGLAHRHKVKLSSLLAANHLTKTSTLKIGQVLTIPEPDRDQDSSKSKK